MSTVPQNTKTDRRLPAQRLTICIFLIAITWLVFGETVRHPSINFDDPQYVFANPRITRGLTLGGVLWAFTQSHAWNWHPLTSISHMIDCQLFGLNAGWQHFTNVLLHTSAVVLLFLVLQQMTAGPSRTGSIWRSAFVAAVFAIHPLRVESVAWIAERKDVLSGLFFMLTVGAYIRYVREPSPRRYLLVALLFALGLMSKPILVTLPIVLLLLDYWPLDRIRDQRSEAIGQCSVVRRLVAEKIPLLALSVASSVITLLVQRQAVGSIELPLVVRINNGIVSYVAYIWQMVWPARLALVYPHPEYLLSFAKIAAAAAFLTGITIVVLVFGRKYRYLVTGWFWYIAMLVPVIGIVQVGPQARADRYTYLPQIGLYLIVTWAIADLAAAWRYSRYLLAVASAIVIGALAWTAWVQDTYWRDSETLWTHTLAVTSRNDTAHENLAELFLECGQLDEAISHSQEALKIRPPNADAHDTLGLALLRKERVNDAVAHWEESLKLRPDGVNAKAHLAWVFATSPDASLRDGGKAIELAKEVQNNAAANDVDMPVILGTLAAGYAETGRFSEAINTAEQAWQQAIAEGNPALAEDLLSNVANYRRNLPLRDPHAINHSR
jgi:protein O-mannosyl-transferase